LISNVEIKETQTVKTHEKDSKKKNNGIIEKIKKKKKKK